MTVDNFKSFFAGKIIQVNDSYFKFESNGELVITNSDNHVVGYYRIISKNNEVFLQSDLPIIGNKKEVMISILIGDCNDGVILSSGN